MSLKDKLPIPSRSVKDIYEVTPAFLREQGIRFLLMDLDNTLSPYIVDDATEELKAWIETLKQGGIEPFIFSNNKGDRPMLFAEQLSLEYVKLAKKPRQGMLHTVLADKGYTPAETAIIGDQIYTDVLCGTIGGLYSIVVKPILLHNPLHTLRYWAEFPFRLAAKQKG
ncbi:MAG: YqeG family HAD IIIA-type phosphatase [Oscillospiraceae bacterium]|nr:YqeG family HAD IIIA-type phosphatase [Oscillospiraceae bacterium]